MPNSNLQVSDAELETLVLSLRARVQRLEDAEEIKRLQRLYVRRLADHEWGLVADDFAPGAVLDVRHRGRRTGETEIAALFERMATEVGSRDGYVLSSPVIDVDGDIATGEWTLHRHVCEFPLGGETVRIYGPWTEGRYHCTYARVDGEWKFTSVVFRVVAPDPDAAARS